jgi:hypothetical protein
LDARLCVCSCLLTHLLFNSSEAASTTDPGSPTKVTTVRLVALPGSTFSKRDPSTVSISSVSLFNDYSDHFLR